MTPEEAAEHYKEAIPHELNNVYLSLDALKSLGWRVRMNQGGWLMERNSGTPERERFSVPHWVRQLVADAERLGCLNAQADMRRALGITKQGEERK